MKRVNYHLTEKQIKELRRVCEETGLSAAEIIRRSIDAYLEVYEEKHRSRRQAGQVPGRNGELTKAGKPDHR